MGWYVEVLCLLLIRHSSQSAGIVHTVDFPGEDVGKLGNEDSIAPINEYEDLKLEELGRLLANILVQPWPRGVSPILYVENNPDDPNEEPLSSNFLDSNPIYKRSRYYRKYPWKRQNSRYDAENRYLCQPSKDDVFRLLVALHEARQGNKGQIINFCNRRRPASAVFTNIRFLG